jgi:23S rRNA (adenine2030-N6)-methyltransferase
VAPCIFIRSLSSFLFLLFSVFVNYRHAFHAGNFADVFKHAILALLLKALHKKDTPFCYLDTHAGAGRYDLKHAAARKTGEYQQGIARLWAETALPAELTDYLAAVRAVNRGEALRFYPGSPRIARFFLRPQDRMVLLEQHPEEAAALKQEFAGDRQVVVHEQDGYQGLKAYLPPPERRGLVLIDPPYEAPDEFDRVVSGLRTAWGRWPTGVYAVWYPLKDRAPVAHFHRRLAAGGIPKILVAELGLYPEAPAFRLNGCGMVLVNPPWQLDDILRQLLPWLKDRLGQDLAGQVTVNWLVPE